MSKKIVGWIVAVVIVVAVVVGIVLNRDEIERPTEPVGIGVILPMTGALAVLGQNEARLLQVTEDVLNEGRPVSRRIRFLIEDAAFDAKKAATIANLFSSKGLPVVMVSTTPLAAPVVPIAEQGGQLTIIHSMTEALLKDTQLALRIYPGIQDEVSAIGSWLKKQPGEPSVYALRLDSEWSAKWVEKFRQEYPAISLRDEPYTLQQINVRDTLAKVKVAKSTHLLLLGYGQEYPSLLRQIKEAGIDVPILGNIGFAYAGTVEAAAKTQSKDLLSGCIFPFLALDRESADFMALDVAYQERFGSDVLQEPGALYFFDTAKLLVNAMNDVGVDPAKIRSHILARQNPYHGITGKITFSPDGNASIALSMARYGENGQIEFLSK